VFCFSTNPLTQLQRNEEAMKTIELSKMHANILFLNLENNKKKPLNRTQRRRMKVIYMAFDAAIEDFVAEKDLLVESCQKEMDAVVANASLTKNEQQANLGEIDRRYGKQLKEVKDVQGEIQVAISLEDGDFQIVHDIWQAQDGFASGREESRTADAIDDAFDAAEEAAKKATEEAAKSPKEEIQAAKKKSAISNGNGK